ncbi:hypothetical protein FisN_24Lh001 [Fistulifera solaris]|uniref:Uncharacterized protein n=1 Tax=Fistulifera solaris TaxID=1519565 RepID=A0A1Z5JAY8_FISSO|nr:hypothetical protein FisN_24Lh001 [Fistulifera solaris]|eukprot:GAX11062.1 hypothetical protein FisN_24Lh001 [Fistulifera solaris]
MNIKLRNLLSSSSGGSSNVSKPTKERNRESHDPLYSQQHDRERYIYSDDAQISPDQSSKSRWASRGRASSVGRALRNGLTGRGRSKSRGRDTGERRSKSLGRDAQREVLTMSSLLGEADIVDTNISNANLSREIRSASFLLNEERHRDKLILRSRSVDREYSEGDEDDNEEVDYAQEDDELYGFGDDHSVASSKASRRRNKQRPSASLSRKHKSQSYDAEEDKYNEKPRKSKMEKIRQLKAKNELYKEEFRRVQKDRKQLKQDLESKKLEVKALQNEVDQHIENTSVLREKLAEAMYKVNSFSENRFDLSQLKRERADTRLELEQAGDRLNEATRRIKELREILRNKEREVDRLKEELDGQYSTARTLRAENERLHQERQQSVLAQASGTQDAKHIHELEEENGRLNSQLGSTLERAATMVKEREDAIADLLKENDELKALINDFNAEKQQLKSSVSDEELQNLKREMKETAKALEASEDRNVLLEDELEAWMKRGNEMDSEIKRMTEQIGKMERALSAAESQAKVTEVTARNVRDEANEARALLQEAEHRHHKELSALQSKYNTAQIDLLKSQEAADSALERAERAEQRASLAEKRLTQSGSFASSTQSSRSEDESSNDANDPHTQQSLMLQQALERKKKSEDARRNASAMRWPFGGQAEELTEDQRRIKDLEEINGNQAEEIKQLKSELVRLKSAYNEAMYINSKRIEQLQKQNADYEDKTHELLVQLSKKD